MAYNGQLANSNLTSGYMDLATAYKLEAEYLYACTNISSEYGDPCGILYFMGSVKRATWFTQVPVVLRIGNGTAQFGQEFSATVAKGGEYLLNAWIALELPALTLLATNQFGVNGRIRWCRRIMHNIIEDCNITCNDQQIARLDNTILDLMSEVSIGKDMQDNYDTMIGDTIDLTGSHGPTTSLGSTIPAKKLNLDLPFFFRRSTALALPSAALLFNDIKLNFKFRDWNKLLVLDNSGVAGAGTLARSVPIVGTDIAIAPVLKSVNIWSTYALVSEFERNQMAINSRDYIIETVQSASRMPFQPVTIPRPIFEPKFTFAVKSLYFAVRNKTFENDWSNYSTSSPYNNGTTVTFSNGDSPVKAITLNYESTTRLSEMDWTYFSQIVPYYTCKTAPRSIGVGLYSYALNNDSIQPNGSTNFSKIGTVQIQPLPSDSAVIATNGTGTAGSGADFAQIFEWLNIACTYSVIRVSDGQITFPFI